MTWKSLAWSYQRKTWWATVPATTAWRKTLISSGSLWVLQIIFGEVRCERRRKKKKTWLRNLTRKRSRPENIVPGHFPYSKLFCVWSTDWPINLEIYIRKRTGAWLLLWGGFIVDHHWFWFWFFFLDSLWQSWWVWLFSCVWGEGVCGSDRLWLISLGGLVGNGIYCWVPLSPERRISTAP